MAERLRERPANLDILGSIPGPGLHFPRSKPDATSPTPMKTATICIGLVIGFVIGLIGASFVVDMMSR